MTAEFARRVTGGADAVPRATDHPGVEDPAAAVVEPVLAVEDLRVHFRTPVGTVRAVDGISWEVAPGETLGIVGESGSGKSVAALAVLGLVPTRPGDVVSGVVRLGGERYDAADPASLRGIRGRQVAMVFQDPLASLDPVVRVGRQVAEVLRYHEKLGRTPAWQRAVDLLGDVGIPDPRQRARDYPHQLSGGMRQRVMIAMALALDPAVLLADEPTSGLDVTVQAQVMQLLERLRAERGTAIVLITHDLGLVAGHADRVAVVYAGRVVERADVHTLYEAPRHAYTLSLLWSLPRPDEPRLRRLQPIPGAPPSLVDVPPGCAFHPRCGLATTVCRQVVPPLEPQGERTTGSHLAACHHAAEVARAAGERA